MCVMMIRMHDEDNDQVYAPRQQHLQTMWFNLVSQTSCHPCVGLTACYFFAMNIHCLVHAGPLDQLLMESGEKEMLVTH